MSVIVLLSAVGVRRFVVHSTTCKSQFHSFVIHRRTPKANPGADNKPEDALNGPTPVNAKGNMSTHGPSLDILDPAAPCQAVDVSPLRRVNQAVASELGLSKRPLFFI